MDYLLNNTRELSMEELYSMVLNLIINGLPSKLCTGFSIFYVKLIVQVLNLIINGLPSKR